MIQAVCEYGLPFMEKNAMLTAIVATMEAFGFGIPEQQHFRLPVMYYLMGQKCRAKEYVGNRLRELGERDDLAAQHYRRFVGALRQRIKH